MMERPTRRRRLPTLSEVANTAALIASDRVSAMTGTVVNLSGGKSSTSGTRGSPCMRPPSRLGRRPPGDAENIRYVTTPGCSRHRRSRRVIA